MKNINNTNNNHLNNIYNQIINLNIKVNVKQISIRMLIDSIGESYYNTPECIAERKEIKHMRAEIETLMNQLEGDDLEDARYITKMHNEIYTNRMRLLMI